MSTKIKNDKYYTSSELAKYVVDKTKEIIGSNNITEYLEPSAGSGVFLDFLDKPYLAYDIEPEDDRIVKQDYLELELEYKKGRCVIGNPPFGRTGKKPVQFFNKLVNECDYISFILPITQLNNNYDFYKFDFIHSEDLGIREYSDRKIHCCLNIYRRPNNNKLNKRISTTLKDIDIQEYQRSRPTSHKRSSKECFDYDIRIVGTGVGSIGKEIEYEGQYVREISIKINNKKHKEQILDLVRSANWKEICKGASGQINITRWRLFKYLKEQIPELE